MAATLRQIMEGIETRLKTIGGLSTSEYARDQITPPFAIVGIPPVENYHQTMRRGRIEVNPTVTVLTSARNDRAGQFELADYANPTGPKSVVEAIEGDKTLGGLVESCHVVSFTPGGLISVGALEYYGGRFQLYVISSGV